MTRYRLLIVATRHGIPPDSGYATDVYGSMEQLAKQGVDVRVLLVDDGKSRPTNYPASLLAGMVSLSRWERPVALGRALLTNRSYVACKWSRASLVEMACRLHSQWPFDLVQAAGSFHMVNALAIKQRCGVKVVMRAQNVESAICERMAQAMPPGWRRALWRREARCLRAMERGWCRSADLCLPISEDDRGALQSLAPGTPMCTVQAGPALTARAGLEIRDTVPAHFFHLGSLDWPPRMEGLLWFLRHVWPIARAWIPGARLGVAGSVSAASRAMLRPWLDQGVEVHGFVEDIPSLLRHCAAVVVPMRCGGGIKIRVVTAWASGWPVVGTSLLSEGLPAEHEVNCLMADQPEDLAQAMFRLGTDKTLRGQLIRAGLATSAAHFSWEAIGRKMVEAHLACLGGKSGV